MKHTREDAGSPSPPAPASISNKMASDISRAEKLCSDALSPSPLQPAAAVSALAAVSTNPASRSTDVPMAEPTTRPDQSPPCPRPERRSERPYPRDGVYSRDPWWVIRLRSPLALSPAPPHPTR
jgi:hypothetical protein